MQVIPKQSTKGRNFLAQNIRPRNPYFGSTIVYIRYELLIFYFSYLQINYFVLCKRRQHWYWGFENSFSFFYVQSSAVSLMYAYVCRDATVSLER